MGNHSLKTYSYYKSQFLLKSNSSVSTKRTARSLSLYYFTNVNCQIFDESSNIHRYLDLSALGNCSLKKRYFTEPRKRFWRFEKASKCLKNNSSDLRNLLKGSFLGYKLRTLLYETIFKFRRKMRNLYSFVLNPLGFLPTPHGFVPNHEGSIQNCKGFAFSYKT